MNFLALFVGLGAERLLTRLFHLREFHWLDPVFDYAFRRFDQAARLQAGAAVVGVVACLVLPLVIVQFVLADRLAHIPQFVFAVLVLLFCLGPEDLGEEVSAYRAAIDAGDEEEIRRLAKGILETNELEAAVPDIEEAVYAQANNRIFAVVFWFAILGPAAAWGFRVLDLMRQKAVGALREHAEARTAPALRMAILLHRLAAYIPARLLMVGYTLAGSYESAVAAWRSPLEQTQDGYPGEDHRRLGKIGCSAAAGSAAEDPGARADRALRLVLRTLWMIWCPALAVLTLYGWLI